MRNNLVKYIFIIFVIVIMGFVLYKLNQSENKEVAKEPTMEIEEEKIKEITLGVSEYDTINPILSNNKYIQEISKIIYEPLMELDSEYKIQKCLVQDWAKTSETTYIFKIADNIKWSNGESLTVEDVMFTIDILKNIPSIYSYNVQYIIKVDKIDEKTVQLTTSHEIPFFEYNLIFPILSKNYYEGQDFSTTDKNQMPIGTGKYKIIENTQEEIVLTKNENYMRQELTLEKIKIKKYSNIGEMYNAFKLGKIDLITTTNINIENYIGTLGYTKKETAGREFDYIAINTQNAVLAHKEVRQALSYIINKDNIIQTLYNNKYYKNEYPLEYGHWLKDEENEISSEYNLEKAKQILQESGWQYQYNQWRKTENYKTTTLSFRIMVQSSNSLRVAIAEMIKSNLEQIGIKANIVKLTDKQYENYLQNKNYDIIITGITLSPSPNLETFFGSGNLANYNNEELNKIMAEVKNITKEELLKEKYKRIKQIYKDEVPYIGLYNSYYAVAANWKLIGNIEANWYNIFMDINNWYKNN